MRTLILSLSVLALLSVSAAGCSIKREFSPPFTDENSVMKLSVQRLFYKKQRLRVWAILENKTNKPYELTYGSFQLVVDGYSYPTARRVPFVRTTHSFELFPRMLKELGALEAVGVSPGYEATLVLDGYGDRPLEVTVPFAGK